MLAVRDPRRSDVIDVVGRLGQLLVLRPGSCAHFPASQRQNQNQLIRPQFHDSHRFIPKKFAMLNSWMLHLTLPEWRTNLRDVDVVRCEPGRTAATASTSPAVIRAPILVRPHCPFAPIAPCHLYFPFASGQLIQSGAGIFHAETYISTQPAEALESTRVPHPHEDQERSRSIVALPGLGTHAR